MPKPEYLYMIVDNEAVEPVEAEEVQTSSLRERLMKREVMESTVFALGMAASLGYIDHLFHGLS